MKKLDMLYEGKAKKVYKTNDEELYIVNYKDDATAFNGKKKDIILGKGIINNKMSNIIFKYLNDNGINTHFVKELNERETLVKKVEIISLEVIVRNIAAGSFTEKYGVPEGTKLNKPIIEFSYKNDSLNDPMINNSQIEAIGIATFQELEEITENVKKVNKLLQKFFLEHNIILVDFKVEYGRSQNSILLADEISPDTCRLWDKITKEKLDKDRFRRDMGNIKEAYEEVWNRIIQKK